MDLSINFDFFLICKIDTQKYSEIFFFILNYLFRNLQVICKKISKKIIKNKKKV